MDLFSYSMKIFTNFSLLDQQALVTLCLGNTVSPGLNQQALVTLYRQAFTNSPWHVSPGLHHG